MLSQTLTALLGCGVGLVIAGRVYHFALHPEWTEMQALRNLWDVWLGAAALMAFGVWLARSARLSQSAE